MARNTPYAETTLDDEGNVTQFGVGGYLVIPVVIVHRVTQQSWGGFLEYQSFIRFVPDLTQAILAVSDLKANYGVQALYIPITIDIEAGQLLLTLKQLFDVNPNSGETFTDGAILQFSGNSQTWNAADISIDEVATRQYVDDSIASLVDTAPDTLDTLNELAAALGDDPNFATTITNTISSLAEDLSPDVSDTPTPNPITGAMWLDTGSTGHLHMWDGEAWVQLTSDTPPYDEDSIAQKAAALVPPNTSNVHIDASAPSSPNVGDLWFDTSTTGDMFVWDGSTWIQCTNTYPFSDIKHLTDNDGLLFDGDYNSLANLPTIPTKLSDLQNDVGYTSGGGYGVWNSNETLSVSASGNTVSDTDTATIPSGTSVAHVDWTTVNSARNSGPFRFVINGTDLYIDDVATGGDPGETSGYAIVDFKHGHVLSYGGNNAGFHQVTSGQPITSFAIYIQHNDQDRGACSATATVLYDA